LHPDCVDHCFGNTAALAPIRMFGDDALHTSSADLVYGDVDVLAQHDQLLSQLLSTTALLQVIWFYTLTFLGSVVAGEARISGFMFIVIDVCHIWKNRRRQAKM
jgi:hypothetical protein